MLIEFSVKNFRSIKDLVRLSMVATNTVSANKHKHVDENNVLEVTKKLKILRSAAIYGANASGKSNIIKALSFMKRLIIDSARESQADEPIDIIPFKLDDTTHNEPSFFEIIFILDKIEYRYGFEVNQYRIISEWLFQTTSIRESKLFIRELDDIRVSDKFKEGRSLQDKTRDNSLFLSLVAQLNGSISRGIISWLRKMSIISGLKDQYYRSFTENSFTSNINSGEILDFIKKLDVGIDSIEIEKVDINESIPSSMPNELREMFLKLNPEQTRIKTIHKKYCNDQVLFEIFDIDRDESEGTKKIFSLAGPIIDTLKKGRILIIDELDARLHPLITRSIINLFNSKDDNKLGAQLVFTTHDTNLLHNDIFRRDQIWFTEKDPSGATHLHSLVEYRVRNDESFEKNYFEGKYGAIPFIGELSSILEVKDE